MLTVDQFIRNIDHLPPLPRNLAMLTELLENPEINIDQVVSLIQYDPALTAQVMRLCNSAYFGASTPASDLHEAATRLGFNNIFQLVASLSTSTLLRPAQKGYGIEPGELWRHSVTSGLIGKCIALERDENPALVFTACLLHDLGKIVLSRNLEEKYDEVVTEAQRSQTPMVAVEKQILGIDHAEIGGHLLRRWQFPAPLAAAVQWHHEPSLAGEHSRLAAYACTANMIACFMGFGCGYQALAVRCRTEAMDILGVISEDIPRFMTKAFYALGDVQAVLDIQF